jgi:hypothetical protein
MVMRFKQFLKEAIFMIRKGDIRIVYTGTLDPDAVYQGFPSYYYDSNHGWMQEWLDNGTKLEFKTLRDLKTEHYAEVSDFADHHAAWLLEEVAAVKLQYPDGFGQGVEFYIDPKDLEKKTVDEAAYKKIVRDWMNSLKEAKKVKQKPIVPAPNTVYTVYGDPPEIFDVMVVTKTPTKPEHGKPVPDDFFHNIPNGQKILFKHKITNADGEFAAIEWNGQTYYSPWWVFPQHITTPEKYKQIQIDWMNSLKEAEGDAPSIHGEQELIIDGEPFYQEIWGYEDKPGTNDDAKPFPNGTKLLFKHYEHVLLHSSQGESCSRC